MKTILLITTILLTGCYQPSKQPPPTLYTIKDCHGEIFYNIEIIHYNHGIITCKDIQNKKHIFSGNFTATELKIIPTAIEIK